MKKKIPIFKKNKEGKWDVNPEYLFYCYQTRGLPKQIAYDAIVNTYLKLYGENGKSK